MMKSGKEYALPGDSWSNNLADDNSREYYAYFQEVSIGLLCT